MALTDHQGVQLTYAGLAAQRRVLGASSPRPESLPAMSYRSSPRPGRLGDPSPRPTGVTVVSELPRNATGKVLRATLREPFWAGRDRLVS